MDTNKIIYTGEYLYKRYKKNNPLKLDVYKSSPELVEAVNLAILLKRPLLIMGEPGCGKTRLAEAVAAELHGENIKDHYFRWNIKSTSRAKDGIYQFDALKRLYHANSKNKENTEKVEDLNNYIDYGEFYKAFNEPQNAQIPNVLLIDEVDKADIDFPNDILLEIEKGEFEIPELKKKIEKKSDAIIFITSNRERELPAAFLRRCLYFYISFPGQDYLEDILSKKFDNNGNITNIIKNAVKLFLDVRVKLEDQLKKPATSELLDWFEIISYYIEEDKNNGLPPNIKSQLNVIKNYKEGSLSDIQLPFPQILLKTVESNQLLGVN